MHTEGPSWSGPPPGAIPLQTQWWYKKRRLGQNKVVVSPLPVSKVGPCGGRGLWKALAYATRSLGTAARFEMLNDNVLLVVGQLWHRATSITAKCGPTHPVGDEN